MGAIDSYKSFYHEAHEALKGIQSGFERFVRFVVDSNTMSNRTTHLVKAIVLALSGLMFYAKISDGTLNFYINQRFAWLSFVAVVLFLMMALTMLYRLLARRSTDAAALYNDHSSASIEANLSSASSGHGGGLSALGLAILALPALMGLLIPARPLGASAISSKGIGLLAPDSPQSVIQVRRPNTGTRNILDWLRDFQREADPVAAFKGQPVDVIGFVYRDARSGKNQFWVSRFAVSCCVADAAALGLLVQTDQATSLKTDTWVRVTGKISTGQFAGETMPAIVPDKIEPVEQPMQPYLYP